jgi:hypothetical protein
MLDSVVAAVFSAGFAIFASVKICVLLLLGAAILVLFCNLCCFLRLVIFLSAKFIRMVTFYIKKLNINASQVRYYIKLLNFHGNTHKIKCTTNELKEKFCYWASQLSICKIRRKKSLYWRFCFLLV